MVSFLVNAFLPNCGALIGVLKDFDARKGINLKFHIVFVELSSVCLQMLSIEGN